MERQSLRQAVLAKRMLLSPQQLQEKSKHIVQRVIEMIEWKQAKVIMAYADFRNEVATGELIVKSLQCNKQVALPLTIPTERRMIPYLIGDYPADLQPGKWGIPEPKSESLVPARTEELDIIFVPGVAFDEKGSRLGYGGGYYDRFLPSLSKHAIFVALAYELQLCQSITPGEHDIPVHRIVTEKRIIDTRK